MTISITVAGVAYPSPSSAADVDWAAQQMALLQALASAVGPLTWSNVAPAVNWAGTLQATKDSQGRVWLRGVPVWGGGGPATGETISILPSGKRPPVDQLFTIASNDASAPNQVVKIHTSGVIENVTSLADGSALYVEQIFFDTQAF